MEVIGQIDQYLSAGRHTKPHPACRSIDRSGALPGCPIDPALALQTSLRNDYARVGYVRSIRSDISRDAGAILSGHARGNARRKRTDSKHKRDPYTRDAHARILRHPRTSFALRSALRGGRRSAPAKPPVLLRQAVGASNQPHTFIQTPPVLDLFPPSCTDHDQAAVRAAAELRSPGRSLWVANSRSGGNRDLEQSSATLPPSVTVQRGRSRCRSAGALRGRRAIERAVDTMPVAERAPRPR